MHYYIYHQLLNFLCTLTVKSMSSTIIKKPPKDDIDNIEYLYDMLKDTIKIMDKGNTIDNINIQINRYSSSTDSFIFSIAGSVISVLHHSHCIAGRLCNGNTMRRCCSMRFTRSSVDSCTSLIESIVFAHASNINSLQSSWFLSLCR